ncbi:MAG: sugar ABC transporter ATP-binding protein [Bacilli bacterium]
MITLEAKHLRKSFGETRALSNCSFECSEGEIHAIIGENGSGKSTLVKVLSGIIRPDDGELRFRGQKVDFKSISGARRVGIVSVPQEILVVPALSVLENVYLGQGRFFSGSAKAEFKERVNRLFSLLSSEPTNLKVPVEELPLSKQQMIVIVRALVLDPPVIILDESTSALDVSDRDRLFSFLMKRREQGKSVVYISHRIDEIQDLADRLTIIRNGESIETLEAKGTPVSTILRLMSGEERANAAENAPKRAVREQNSAVILRAVNVSLSSSAPAVNFSVSEGEIVGLAGLEGQGQENFLTMLGGHNPSRLQGQVVTTTHEKQDVPVASLRQAFEQGIVYIPRDRKTEGLFLKLPIKDNFALPTYKKVIDQRKISSTLRLFKDQLSMVYDRDSQSVGSLSGGNQQKVVLARWLNAHPRILLLNDPTRGVDIPTKRDLYRLFRELAQNGVAIVLLSTDLEELIELCDRVAVFREGNIFSDLVGQAIQRDRLIAGMFGEAI